MREFDIEKMITHIMIYEHLPKNFHFFSVDRSKLMKNAKNKIKNLKIKFFLETGELKSFRSVKFFYYVIFEKVLKTRELTH